MDTTTTIELGRISNAWAVRVDRDGQLSMAVFTGRRAKAEALAFYGSVSW